MVGIQNSTIAPVAGQYTTLAMAVDISGVARFFINEVLIGTAMTGALGQVRVTPVFAVSKRSGASSFTLTIDRVYARIFRTVDGGAD